MIALPHRLSDRSAVAAPRFVRECYARAVLKTSIILSYQVAIEYKKYLLYIKNTGFYGNRIIFPISQDKDLFMQYNLEYITGTGIYEKVLMRVPETTSFLWLATSDLKDLYIHKNNRMVPFLEILSDLVEKGIPVRLIHAKEPGPAFREDFDRYPALINGLERLLCPRVHFKLAVIDGVFAYSGSANLTGAGMGAKSGDRRNFEAGFITEDAKLVACVMEQFDAVWMGKYCDGCKRKELCPDRPEMVS